MNWLITGGCGFLGTSLIARLVAESGHNIRVIDNLSVGTKKDLSNVCSYSEIMSNDISGAPEGIEQGGFTSLS